VQSWDARSPRVRQRPRFFAREKCSESSFLEEMIVQPTRGTQALTAALPACHPNEPISGSWQGADSRPPIELALYLLHSKSFQEDAGPMEALRGSIARLAMPPRAIACNQGSVKLAGFDRSNKNECQRSKSKCQVKDFSHYRQIRGKARFWLKRSRAAHPPFVIWIFLFGIFMKCRLPTRRAGALTKVTCERLAAAADRRLIVGGHWANIRL
jgi:hypothetical protein